MVESVSQTESELAPAEGALTCPGPSPMAAEWAEHRGKPRPARLPAANSPSASCVQGRAGVLGLHALIPFLTSVGLHTREKGILKVGKEAFTGSFAFSGGPVSAPTSFVNTGHRLETAPPSELTKQC